MIWNVIDRRLNPHRWQRIRAAVEPTSHDNGFNGDQAESSPDETIYAEREDISLADAIAWANGLPGALTLYLFDKFDEKPRP